MWQANRKVHALLLTLFDSRGNCSNALGWWEYNQPFYRVHGRTYTRCFLYEILDITGVSGFVRWLAETLLYTFLGLVIGSLIAVLRQARTT